MNTATARARRDPKHPSLPDSSALVALKGKIFFSDNLRRRWEQIVSKGRA